MATLTAYAAYDAWLGRQGINSTDWTTVRDTNVGSNWVSTSDASNACVYLDTSSTPNFRNIRHGVYNFDTSSIGDSDTIDSAVLSIYGNGTKTDTYGGTPDPVICASTISSDTAFAGTDYVNHGTTKFSNVIAYADWNASSYNDFTFVTAGKNSISKTGYSKYFVMPDKYYVSQTSSPPALAASKNWEIGGYYSEQTGTTNDPKLVVTYSSTAVKTINGLAKASVKTINSLAVASIKSINGLT